MQRPRKKSEYKVTEIQKRCLLESFKDGAQLILVTKPKDPIPEGLGLLSVNELNLEMFVNRDKNIVELQIRDLEYLGKL